MKTLNTTYTALAFFALVAFVLVALTFNTRPVYGSAPTGLKTTLATTSQLISGTSAILAFATSTCDARIVTTSGQPVTLTFSDYSGQVPTGSFGHLQAASTTVTYDSGQYGCGAMKMFSFGTQLVTVSESR